MRSIYTIWRMMARRSLANWRLAATLVLGVLVASTLLAAAPIYARAMADLGLTFAIRDRLAQAPTTQVQFRDLPIATEDGRRVQDAVIRRTEERIGWFTGNRERIVQGPRFVVAGVGADQAPAAAGDGAAAAVSGDITPDAAILAPQAFSSLERQVRVVQGRLPAPQTGADGRRVLELALSARAAEAAGLTPGDRLTLAERFDDCAREIPSEDRPPPPPCFPKLGVRFTLPAQIVGLVEPIDPDSPFWVVRASSYFDPVRLLPGAGPLVPALTDEESFFAGLGGQLPGYRASVSWSLFADPTKLSRANYMRARDDIIALREDLGPIGGFAYSPLQSVLEGFGRELKYQQTPLVLLLLQITGIALFYVGVISAMVVERQAEEIALLRSRGAGRMQVAGLYLLEGLTVGVPVTLVAPFLAALVTALLGATPAFDRVTGGALLPVRIGSGAFALAAAGATLSLVMLAGPAFLAARMTGITSRRQAARPGAPLLRRYSLDLAVAALAALLLWELRERGSVFTPSSTGGVSSDPLLLLSPALLTLGVAAVLLRFYPALLRAAAWLLGRVAGAPVVLGLWQLIRNPGGYTRLALLLMMAVAVGTFAASYASTAERSFRDRAAFQAGVDLRLTAPGDTPLTEADLTRGLGGIPGIDRASSVMRRSAQLGTPGGGSQDVTVLGLDPAAASDLLWFRDDLADEPLPDLLAHLAGPPLRGKPLPLDATELRLWVNPAEPRETVTMWVRVRDAAGTVAMFELGKLDFTGWRQLRAPLNGPYAPRLTPPMALMSVVMSEPPTVTVTRTAPVYLDDITAASGSSETVIEDFEGPLAWAVAPSRAPTRGATVQDEFKTTAEQKHGGASAGQFTFRTGSSTGLRGLYVTDPAVPLPVVVSPEFLAVTGTNVGGSTLLAIGDTLVPVIVRGVTRLFPTVPAGTPLVIVNRDHWSAWVGAFSDQSVRLPNEVWLRLAPGADRQAVQAALVTSPLRLGNAVDREQVLASVNANPLIAAGGSGILVAAFVAVIVLVGVALLVTVVTSVQRRRTEFAVMRAMGLSRGQVFRLLLVEYALIAALGLVVGVWLGLIIGRRMLSFLDATEAGTRVAPPFILQTDWLMVATAVAAIALTFIAGMWLSTRTLEAQPAGQSLRQTD